MIIVHVAQGTTDQTRLIPAASKHRSSNGQDGFPQGLARKGCSTLARPHPTRMQDVDCGPTTCLVCIYVSEAHIPGVHRRSSPTAPDKQSFPSPPGH